MVDTLASAIRGGGAFSLLFLVPVDPTETGMRYEAVFT